MHGFQAGAAVRDITPPADWIRGGRVWLWGFGSRTEPCAGVREPLSVRALVIRDEAGETVALVSADLGALDPRMTDAVCARIERSLGIPAECICLNVTHTHGAPVPVSIPTWLPGFCTPDAAYPALVEDRIVGAIEDAARAAAPALIRFGRTVTDIGKDRHFGEPGFHDPTLDVLKIDGVDGGAIAIAFFTACHPVCLSDLNEIYADFPYIARREVERSLGGIALFFQGFAGISNPVVRDAQTIGLALAKDVIGALDGSMRTIDGPARAWSSAIDLPFQPLPGPELRVRAREAGGIYARWERAMAEPGGMPPAALPTPIQAIKLGTGDGAWYLAASSHEVTADLAEPIRALRPGDRLTPIGFSNSQLSYLPSRRVLTLPPPQDQFPFSADNYDGGMSFAWYGHRAPLALDAAERFVAAFRDLLLRESAGR